MHVAIITETYARRHVVFYRFDLRLQALIGRGQLV